MVQTIRLNRIGSMELTFDNVLPIVLLAAFVAVMLIFINSQANVGVLWSDYYAKEVVKLINLGSPGDEITISVQKATKIGAANHVGDLNQIFQFDNENNEVCVKLTPGSKTCYSYFRDVRVVNPQLKLASPENVLEFKIVEASS